MNTISEVLSQIAEGLDISPSDYALAQDRFNAVQAWLADGQYKSGSGANIFLQGSFRLGTVVRPLSGDSEGDYDIDQVCELTIPHANQSPGILKHDIGNRLSENDDYRRMMDEEGRRCWTLVYSSSEGRPGFHIDVLPAITSSFGEAYQIDITDKSKADYSWKSSNPNGYYHWFKARNTVFGDLVESQRQRIYAANGEQYKSASDVPLQLVRTSLQRAIQVMKRHRDTYFLNLDNKPISIILTTITTHHYDGSPIRDVIRRFARYVIDRHETLLRDGGIERDGVLDFIAGKWLVRNPVHAEREIEEQENFADKWSENSDLTTSFFAWVYQLDRDLSRFDKSGQASDLNLRTNVESDGEIFVSRRLRSSALSLEQGNNPTDDLLDLVHLGIEGELEWDQIRDLAKSIFDNAEGVSKDVAKVNFYQVALHRGKNLSEEAKNDIRRVLEHHSDSAAFRMCCHILLGSVTREMIRDCLAEGKYADPLRWPIMRLVPDRIVFPGTT